MTFRRYQPVFTALSVIPLLALLVACGTPFVDSRREAGKPYNVGASSPNAPVVCYAKSETSPEEVAAMANAVCAESERVARFDSETVLSCRMMQPWRAQFTCVDPGAHGAGTLPPGPSNRTTNRAPQGWGSATGGGVWSGGSGSDGAVYPGGGLPEPPRL